MKLTTFNPVRQASIDQRGFQGMARRQFSTALCWSCQKDKPRLKGQTSMAIQGVNATAFGNMRRFVCADCVAAKEKKAA